LSGGVFEIVIAWQRPSLRTSWRDVGGDLHSST